MRATACATVVLFLLAGCGERARPLGAANAPEEIGQQIDRLADNNPDVRFQARWTLANFGPRAIPFLIEALDDDNPHVCQEAAAALGGMYGIDRSAAVTPLTERITDLDPEVRAVVIEALGSIGPPARSAAPALAKALTDEDMRTRRSASVALVRVLGDDAVPLLREALADARSQRCAAAALRDIGPAAQPAIPDLERLAEDKDPALRNTARDALEHIRHGGYEKATAP